jgi:GNAT superfamily N-acetyltransferase
VRQATLADLGAVRSLCEESCGYYRSPPIFLEREGGKPDEYYAECLGSPGRALFLAMDGGRAVGFMSVRRCGGLNYYDLSDPGTALIDEMGAYIVPGHRGSGLGKALLAECVGWCRRSGIPRIHVDFESANVPARRFWLRHFAETARSVRRSVYRDIVR